jgi:hypothetical protein
MNQANNPHRADIITDPLTPDIFTDLQHYLGSVLSKDPIRRVYCSADAMVVETRARRAVISDAPPSWE